MNIQKTYLPPVEVKTMRKDNDRDANSQWLSRRHYLAAVAGAGAVSLAGCSGDTGSGGDGNGDGGAVSDTISVLVRNLPQQSNVNPWAATAKSTGMGWTTEMGSPSNPKTGERILSGQTFKSPWIEGKEEISIATMLKDLKVNPPFDYTKTYDDRITYWDGTPMDAKAHKLHDLVYYYYNGRKFDKAETFNNEVVDQWTYHSWRDKGKVKGQKPAPTNKRFLRYDVLPSGAGDIPIHPEFTKPYVEKYKDATTEQEVNDITDELSSDNISFNRLADKGWGSGLYRIESSDDISGTSATAKMRDDHPNSEHASISKLEMKFATSDRVNVLRTRGKIDIGDGYIAENGGVMNRAAIPDHIQQAQSYLQLGGDQIMFNWENKHLQNLWVRRAIIAAVDWNQLSANGWGPNVAVTSKHHTGLLDTTAERVFSKEFLDKLHTYPQKSDIKTATKWMKKAGYTKQGERWHSPDGSKATIELNSYGPTQEYIAASQTLKANLEELGIKVKFKSLSNTAFTKALKAKNTDFHMMLTWAGETKAWQTYWTHGYWWNMGFVGGDPNDSPQYEVDYKTASGEHRDTHDAQGMPLQVEVPKKIGSIKAPNKAGKSPNLPNGEKIDIAKQIYVFREPDLTDKKFKEAARKCARFYNFYLPDFMFHQYKYGLWGNVRDFDFAPVDQDVNFFGKEFGTSDFQVLGGVVQTKDNTNYKPPK
jgi:hypothetical protein